MNTSKKKNAWVSQRNENETKPEIAKVFLILFVEIVSVWSPFVPCGMCTRNSKKQNKLISSHAINVVFYEYFVAEKQNMPLAINNLT